MDSTDIDGASGTHAPGQPDMSRRRTDGLSAVVEKDITRREKAVIDDEAAVLDREQSATAREEAAASREEEIRVASALKAASDKHMRVLQQANSQLVIATVEAQKLTAQLQRAKAQLERAKSVAEKANLAKSDFLSSMSHELRTPLNAILGFAQLMESGSPPPTPTQTANIKQILQAGWYLLTLINQILDLAVIESGKLSISLEPVSLQDIMRQCQDMTESQAQQRDIHVNFLQVDNTWFVYADRMRIKQALLNLLSNAIKYNRAHGTVEVKCTASSPERLRISVKDNGAGLNAEHLAHLFEPFNRLGQENGAQEGTGIGLVVTKRLVELMGGAIGVESTVGVGSEFWIELTRDTMPKLAAQIDPRAEFAPPSAGSASLRTVLYVEDNPSNLVLVAQIIERHPHLRMLSASDGDLGLALARAHLPDVILMDINLRGTSGFQVLEALQSDPQTAHIPVLAISANAMPRDIEKGLAVGFLRYLTKPIKLNEFEEAMDMALAQTQPACGRST